MFKKIFFLSVLSLKLSGLKKPYSLSSYLSILSLTLGVSTLILSLALVDSYEKAYKEGIFSAYSHANLTPLNPEEKLSFEDVENDIEKIYKKKFNVSPISRKEALLANKGKVSGVAVIGVDSKNINDVISLKTKITDGSFFTSDFDHRKNLKQPQTLIGKGIQEAFDFKVGDSFSIVIPFKDYTYSEGFQRKVLKVKIKGVVDFGTHDYNKRFVLVERAEINKVLDKPENFFTEVRVKLSHDEDIFALKDKFFDNYQSKYWLRTWDEESGGLLEAIKIEKMVIFFLVLIMVVVAAFNVSTNLFLNISKRHKDFSVLQAIGLKRYDIVFILISNGLTLALIGVLCGSGLAYLLKFILNFILKNGYFIPPEVYKLTSITIAVDGFQILIVGLATTILCLIASIAPSFSIFKQSIVEGVKYE